MVWRKCLARRRPCGSRRAAGDGMRSGPGDSDPDDGPAARFAAEAARYDQELWRISALRSEQALPAMGCAAAPAILIQTTVPKFAADSLELWFGAPTKPAKGLFLMHRRSL